MPFSFALLFLRWHSVRGGDVLLSRHRHQLSFPVDIRLLWAGARRLRGGYPKKERAEGASAGRRRGRQAGEEGGGPAKRAAGRGRGQRAGEEDSRPGKKTASRGRRQRVGEKDSGPGKRTAGRGRRQQAGKEDSGPEGKGWTGDRGKARLKRKGLAQEVRRGPGKARRISFFLPAGLNEWQSGHPPY